MTKVHPIPVAVTGKPQKPRPDFPLFPHAAGYWAKKIRGRLVYFGRWDDPQGALAKYNQQAEDLHAGRTPGRNGDVGGVTLRDLCNRFWTTKKHKVDSGELTHRSLDDYYATCERILDAFGKARLVSDLKPLDFERFKVSLAKTRKSPAALSSEIQRVRTVFKYAFDEGIIDKPLRFGEAFKKPSQKTMRQHRSKRARKLLTPPQVRALIRKAGVPLKAMVLLGCNCGYGNNDVATLKLSCLNLAKGLVTHARPKTGIERRCPLWPETIAALRAAIAECPKAADEAHGDLVFLTKYGQPWSHDTYGSALTHEFTKLLERLKLDGRGFGFYDLRRLFETVGGDTRDQVAVDALMGHAPPANDMASVYRLRIADERLQAVVQHVRRWVFGA